MAPYECGVIVAGGKSSRMGRDKALLPFGGEPTMTHFLYRRLEPLFVRLYVSAKQDKFDGAFPLVKDTADTSSPLVALTSVLETLPHDPCFVVSVDTPFIDDTVVKALYRASRPNDTAIVARLEKQPQPLCAIYTARALPTVKRRLEAGEHTMRALLDALKPRYVDFDAAYRMRFANLNRPDEYEAAIKRLREP